jgi:hypothetical protein
MANQYSIAVLLPTRSRTHALTESVTSIVARAQNPSRIQILFGFDTDDEVGLSHFENVIQPFLDDHGVSYEAQAFESMGYSGLNRYYNHLGQSADADWMFIWNDDAVMDTDGWDQVIDSYTGQFRLLKVHTHNEHPYSIFPIVPRAWYDLFGHFSRHQMIDAELSQMAFVLDLMQVIDVHVTHNQVELTKDATDPLKPKVRFEGDPNNPWDFHHPAVNQQRYRDCDAVSVHMKKIGLDTTWWENIKSGKQYPWKRLQELDINNQMRQFDMRTNDSGKVIEIKPTAKENVR